MHSMSNHIKSSPYNHISNFEFIGLSKNIKDKIIKILNNSNINQTGLSNSSNPLDILRHPKVFEILPMITQLHLTYDISRKINRNTITEIIKRFPKGCVAVGSYRRLKPTSKDIDLLTFRDLNDVISDVKSSKHMSLKASFGGELKQTLIVQYNDIIVSIDLFKTTPRLLPYAMLHYTGSPQHNIIMRVHARSRGFKLSQNGLSRINTKGSINSKQSTKSIKSIESEYDIFKAISMEYKKPELRI